jgi:hypothetical protein
LVIRQIIDASAPQEANMNEEVFNLSVRKFLKGFGVSAQHEIEQAVAQALAGQAIAGTETFPARITLEIGRLKLNFQFEGDVALA